MSDAVRPQPSTERGGDRSPPTWRRELADGIRDVATLRRLLELPPEMGEQAEAEEGPVVDDDAPRPPADTSSPA